MAANRACLAILLVGLALAYIFTQSYFILMLFILSVLLPLASLAMLLIVRKKLSLAAELPESMGKNGPLVYILKNSSPLPISRVGFSACLQSLMSGAKAERRIYCAAPGGFAREVELSIERACCGRMTLETKDIAVYDSFCVFRIKMPPLPAKETMIMPQIGRLELSVRPPVRISGEGEKFSPDKPGPDVCEMFALREYAPGDELRKVHWKLSSKIDKLMVRDFSLPLNYSVFLLMDIEGSDEPAIDACAEALLSCSSELLEDGIPHSVAWFDPSGGALAIRDVTDTAELALMTPELLSATTMEDPAVALRLFAQSTPSARRLTVIYFTTRPHYDEIAALALFHDVLIMRAGNESGGYPTGFDVHDLRVRREAAL